jgi:2'-5' RNA ligase
MSFNYFLAAILDEETKSGILQYGLDPRDPRLQHTTPTYNMHITVGYIGQIPEDILPKVATCFKPLEEFSEIELSISGVDFFGGGDNFKRYIGLTIADPKEKLKQLNKTALKLLQQETELTFRGHREYKPHITFQLLKHRLKSQERHHLIDHAKHLLKEPTRFWIKSLGLWYRNPKTQRYESLCDYQLQNPR